MFFFFPRVPSPQRKLQIPLLRHSCEARFAAQQTPGRHAVHGPQTAAGPAETEVGILFPGFLWGVGGARGGADYLNFLIRFKPVQKFDTCSGENYSSGGQSHPGAAEQTVIAQSQHHQQFLGQSACNAWAYTYLRVICTPARFNSWYFFNYFFAPPPKQMQHGPFLIS